MHPKTHRKLQNDLTLLKSQLQSKFGNRWESKYKEILQELVKLRKDPDEIKGYQLLENLFPYLVEEFSLEGENNLQDNIFDIGMLLNSTHELYNKSDAQEEGNDVYQHLTKLLGA